MKRIAVLLCTVCFAMVLASCSGQSGQGSEDESSSQSQQDIGTNVQSTDQESEENAQSSNQESVAINSSPDKYTWYVKDYVGMNAASVGYYALNGDRCDTYGSGYLRIIFVADDGTYLNPEDDEQLSGWVVTGQSLEPNTEIKLTFEEDSDGEEYDGLVLCQNYEAIALSVTKVGQDTSNAISFTEISPSPDKYTRYVRDYTGMNAASVGYESLGGDYCDRYGVGYVKLTLMADDGTYFDPADVDTMSQYVVTGQNVEPNTAITMTFSKDSEGNEYSNLVEAQSIDSITLNVSKISE